MPNRRVAVFFAAFALLLSACPNEFGQGEGPSEVNTPPDNPYWCCDADDFAGCTCEGYWACTEGVDGSKRCIQQNPEMPDDGSLGGWDCQYRGEMIVCEGDAAEHPEEGLDGGWNCATEGDVVICERDQDQGDFPNDGSDGPFDCVYDTEGNTRACTDEDGGLPDDGWDCLVGADGRTVCTNEELEEPDDGDWDCYRQEDGSDICYGEEMPEGGGGGDWDCQEANEMIVCESDEGQLPDDGGNGDWECGWGENGLVCEGEGQDDGGEGEGEGEGQDDCDCIVGASRYCDEPEFCNWGRQTCETVGGQRRWGTCAETDILAGCQPGGADAQDFEWNYRDGFWDGQVNDPDGDGVILMPPDFWYSPNAEDCAIRKGFCVQDMWDLDRDLDIQESIGDDCADIEECV